MGSQGRLYQTHVTIGLNTHVFLPARKTSVNIGTPCFTLHDMLSWLPVETLTIARENIVRVLVTLLARVVKKPQVTHVTMDKDVAYHIPSQPLSSTWLIVWRGYFPIAMQCKPNWYILSNESDMSSGIKATIAHDGSPRFSRIIEGKEVCLHKSKKLESAIEVPILEARLCGKPGSMFMAEFPEGVDVKGVVRIPTFATLEEIIPCVLAQLRDVKRTVAFEDPALLYLSVLVDESFDEVTFHSRDVLVV